jgi:glycosyltransferase involved in cell wall biosynthesis
MKTIIHISADYPDPLVAGKTRAVKSLIESAPGFRHVVYSLNRISWRSGVAGQGFGEEHLAIAYGAPPYGVRLTHHLGAVADFIVADAERRKIRPDLIHAHKFTVESFIAAKLSSASGAPFIASLWGTTDRRIFEGKPALRGAYRAMARQAAMLLPAAPWTCDYFAAALNLDPGIFEILPVITLADRIIPPTLSARPHFASAFNFDSWKRKGFDVLVQAVATVAREIGGITLDVYGRGGPAALLDITALIRGARMENHIKLMPALDHAEVQRILNSYTGFVLPSRPETYGMVYAEALLGGVPILWSQNQGVDGFFDPADVGYRCDPGSVENVADGIRHLIADQARLKTRIGALQTRGAFEMLRRDAIGAQYVKLLGAAMREESQATLAVSSSSR